MWKECTEECFNEALGCLPPALMLGHGFLLGEPFDHRRCTVTGNVAATYAAFVTIGGRYYAGPHMTIPEFRKLDPRIVPEGGHA